MEFVFTDTKYDIINRKKNILFDHTIHKKINHILVKNTISPYDCKIKIREQKNRQELAKIQQLL